jgi:hypothetical protein
VLIINITVLNAYFVLLNILYLSFTVLGLELRASCLLG